MNTESGSTVEVTEGPWRTPPVQWGLSHSLAIVREPQFCTEQQYLSLSVMQCLDFCRGVVSVSLWKLSPIPKQFSCFYFHSVPPKEIEPSPGFFNKTLTAPEVYMLFGSTKPRVSPRIARATCLVSHSCVVLRPCRRPQPGALVSSRTAPWSVMGCVDQVRCNFSRYVNRLNPRSVAPKMEIQ